MAIIVAEPIAPYKVATFGTILVVSEPSRTAAGSLRAELAAVPRVRTNVQSIPPPAVP